MPPMRPPVPVRSAWSPRRLAIALLGAVLPLLAPAANACAVCFGQTDSPLGKGLHWGVLALLAFIFAVLAVFGAFAIFLARRSALCEAEQAAEEGRAKP